MMFGDKEHCKWLKQAQAAYDRVNKPTVSKYRDGVLKIDSATVTRHYFNLRLQTGNKSYQCTMFAGNFDTFQTAATAKEAYQKAYSVIRYLARIEAQS